MVRVNRSMASGRCSSNLRKRRCAHAHDVGERQARQTPAARQQAQQQVGYAEEIDRQEDCGGHQQAEAEDVGGAVFQVGLLDDLLQAPQHADPVDQVAQEGEGAALLAPQHWGADRLTPARAGAQFPQACPSISACLLLGNRPDVIGGDEEGHRKDQE